MLEQLSNSVTFYFYFTATKQGKTGLTVTGKARRISDGTEFTLTITELDATDFPGIYTAVLAGADTGTESDYLAFAKTADSTVDVQHVPALWVIGKAGIENLDSTISGVQADTNDIQLRLPAALVGGRMDVSVGAMAANVLTASALATDAVSEIVAAILVTPANKIATNADGSIVLNMAQTYDESVTTATLGGALNAARTQGFGKWLLIPGAPGTLRLYRSNGSTTLLEFTIDDTTNPTTRTPL